MNLDQFIPLSIDMAFCAAIIMSRKYRMPEVHRGDLVYAYPSWLGYKLLVIGLFMASAPLWPGAQGDENPLIFDAMFWFFSLIGIGLALNIFRYRLIIGRDKLVISVLLKEEIDFSKIAEVQYVNNGRSAKVVIRLTEGRRMIVEGLMSNLPSLAKQLGDRVSANGRGATGP